MIEMVRFISMRLRAVKGRFSSRPRNDLFFKQQRLLEIGRRYRCTTLVETGTYLGDTVKIARRYFDRVLSVELSAELHQKNLERLKKYKNVLLWQGSSGQCLPEMLLLIPSERVLFWLDAHYSGTGTAKGGSNCPIISELEAIAAHPVGESCILIDDARCFGTEEGYPPIEQIRDKLMKINPNYHIRVENDCIMALPPSG